MQHFQSVALSNLRYPVESMLDGVGSNAIGERRQSREILLDLPGFDLGAGFEGVL
jgi:hypothetical protein